jgi:3-phosphoshikimate 1-carboxyvinyltransferase
LSIRGGKPVAGAFKSHGDHRIAMAFAVAANALGEASTVSDWPAVASSYPEFANDLARVTDS